MSIITPTGLRKEITSVLQRQGYIVKPEGFFELKNNTREEWHKTHELSKAERISANEQFILGKIDLVKKYMIDGKDLDMEKIDPKIIEIKSGSKEEDLFRWWNLVWWSLPYEHAYGRQMRFIVWDKYHNAPIGLIGLQSPILSWGARDRFLDIKPAERDYWVNQSLNAQRIGALPPYNDVRGSKLVTLLMTSEDIRKRFQKKYKGKRTLMRGRKLPPNLLFLTTTGAYGKSSIYNRLKFEGEKVSDFIGYTQGSGTFHIPNALYEDLMKYLEKKGIKIERGYGHGPSRKLRLIDQALQLLGFANGITHGIKRAVYIFPLARNVKEVIGQSKKPIWYHRKVQNLTDFWKQRWAKPCVEKNKSYQEFSKENFISQTIKDVKKYSNL